MRILRKLKKLKSIPFTHTDLLSVLSDYKNPNDKIKNMVKSGEIIRIKKELYVVGDLFREQGVNLELIANTIFGPSYVSMEWALSYYGLIPERVYEITSITTKMLKTYNTPFGRFSYIKGNKSLYPIGITLQQDIDETSFMIASKEKALCDKLVYTQNLAITSKKAMIEYLEEDLQIDLDDLKDFNLSIIEQCIQCGYKTTLLKRFYKVLQDIKDKKL